MENVSRKEQEKQSSNAGKIIAIVAGAVVLIGGLVAGGIYLATHQEQTTIISSSDSSASFTLVDGKNKITKGGTYTFTGSTSKGKIEVETAEDVKIILNGVSITNSSGAAIKSKGTGKLTIELVGDNTLVTTDNTADDPAAVGPEPVFDTGTAAL